MFTQDPFNGNDPRGAVSRPAVVRTSSTLIASQRMADVRRQLTFRPNPDIVAQRVGSEIVLVNLQTNRIYELNRTGGRLWELITEGCDLSEIRQRLETEFDVDEGQLSHEVEAFLSLLQREALVTSAEPESK